jgi:transcriptional regulator with XRE-family HTH domain
MATGFPEQDPHRVRDERENILEVAIGREVRAFRARAGMTVAELSKRTGLSIGMLSKIENGNTSPSLTTLQSLSHALNVPVTAFFRRFEDVHNAVHTKSGQGVEMERRGTRAGHQYNLLGHLGQNASGVVVEPYLITLDSDSDVFPTFQHEGIETIYMLEGRSGLSPRPADLSPRTRRYAVLRCRCAARARNPAQAAGALSVDHRLQVSELGPAAHHHPSCE